MGKKLLKDEGKLFARISCTCSACSENVVYVM